MKSREHIWDMIAPSWSEVRTEMPSSVALFLNNKSSRLLDLGCGSGRNFPTEKTLEVYGVDFSEKMLAYAAECSRKKHIDANLVKSPVWKTTFNDFFFDTVLCYSVLHCIQGKDKRNATLSEIHRLLKKEGEAFISTWGKNSSRLTGKKKECFVPWDVNGTRVMRYTYIFGLEELCGLCTQVGFEILRAWEDENVNVVVGK